MSVFGIFTAMKEKLESWFIFNYSNQNSCFDYSNSASF